MTDHEKLQSTYNLINELIINTLKYKLDNIKYEALMPNLDGKIFALELIKKHLGDIA
jgi:hypothetical protein